MNPLALPVLAGALGAVVLCSVLEPHFPGLRRRRPAAQAAKPYNEITCHHHSGLESLCPRKVIVPSGAITEDVLEAYLPEGWAWKRLSVDFTLVTFCPEHRHQARLLGR
ncbi:hypothetical protein OG453_07245 [Streptomyces sp. NBC_01381]|uniref:hypothetical protein n=1 Tax=Streptomyces sp. NBC_01381 TaxID=2903845 RepID=UPI002252A59B|nr:hypothetical protein [Streptomyces sp. NBC_01381]MCX4666463.1 hypothetical protein [Streptomyces sp. NBC_01381]